MDLLRFVIVGSVDDGKSTLIGRLMHDLGAVPEDQMKAIRTANGTDFSLLTDGLLAEREQGITIDVAYRYFSSARRQFIVADTPGHESYTRNMVTGASNADLAVILVDATQGVRTQTRRHAFLASLLGIPRFLVLVNKMDVVAYSQAAFDRIASELREFAGRLNLSELRCIPISATGGDNVAGNSERMPWYAGETVAQFLDHVYVASDRNPIDFRLPVQLVIRGTGDEKRHYAGRIVSGAVRKGEEVVILPSLERARIRELRVSGNEANEASAPASVSVSLDRELDISRGCLIARPGNVPRSVRRFEAMMAWLGNEPLDPAKTYLVKHTSRQTRAWVRSVSYRIDVNTLHREAPGELGANAIARVGMETAEPVFVDPYERNRATGSFILIDPVSGGTVAAGMVIDRIPLGTEPPLQGASPGALTLWLTGLPASGKSTLARQLEARIRDRGAPVVWIDGDALRAGLCKDLGFSAEDRSENVRRAAEIARMLNASGIEVIVSLISPLSAHRESARGIIGHERFFEVFVDAPASVCEQRDPKGLYARARSGEIPGFTGVQETYEPPRNPDLRVDTAALSPSECVERILQSAGTRKQ